MAEQYLNRHQFLYANQSGGTYDKLSELVTASNEVPSWIWRGDTLPSSPQPWSRWYVADAGSPTGAGNGEWFLYDPARGAFVSESVTPLQFYLENGATLGGSPTYLKMLGGLSSAIGVGYPVSSFTMASGAYTVGLLVTGWLIAADVTGGTGMSLGFQSSDGTAENSLGAVAITAGFTSDLNQRRNTQVASGQRWINAVLSYTAAPTAIGHIAATLYVRKIVT